MSRTPENRLLAKLTDLERRMTIQERHEHRLPSYVIPDSTGGTTGPVGTDRLTLTREFALVAGGLPSGSYVQWDWDGATILDDNGDGLSWFDDTQPAGEQIAVPEGVYSVTSTFAVNPHATGLRRLEFGDANSPYSDWKLSIPSVGGGLNDVAQLALSVTLWFPDTEFTWVVQQNSGSPLAVTLQTSIVKLA